MVLGPSGCGKTTLLNLIAGFVPYQHGSIQLAVSVFEGPGAERGVVFQNEGLLPWRNVQNNVAFGLQLAGIEKMQRLEIAHQMLKKVGLEGAEKRYIWQLSGGQRQRVGIARALAAIPQPLLRRTVWCAGCLHPRPDANPAAKLWQETGKQVLLITHDIEEKVVFRWRLNWFCFHPALAACWSGCRSTLLAALLRESRAAASSPIHNSSPCANMF